MNELARTYLQNIHLPEPSSHKGQNGKVLAIGGSELFHAASKWSLDVVSKFVDMVFYASVPSNNALIQAAKGEFWNGIVIRREDIEGYADEADCILIGPGMERNEESRNMVNSLLQKYTEKKMVIDAGALQMVDPHLLTPFCIVTPHQGEWERLVGKKETASPSSSLFQIARPVVVVKGKQDIVFFKESMVVVDGGNAGMTKGGTGDVLAGLIAALYSTHDAMTAAVVGSYINKKAGDALYESVGPYFNASDLVEEIPRTMWRELQTVTTK